MSALLTSAAACRYYYILALGLLFTPLPSWAQAPAWQAVTALGSNIIVQDTAPEANGNIYLSGYFQGTVSFGATSLTSAGNADLFVAKWNPVTKSFLWAQRIGGTGSTSSLSHIAVNGPSIYLTGSFTGPTITVGTTTLPGNVSQYGYVIKLTDTGSSGNFTWAQLIKGNNSNDGVYSFAIAVSGSSVYVAGGGYGPTIYFGSIALPLVGYSDAFVARITDAGSSSSFTWARRAGGTTTNDQASIIDMVAQNNAVYMCGLFSGSVFFDASHLNSNNPVNTDILVAKLTDSGTSGAFNWAVKGINPAPDFINKIAVSGAGVYIAGSFNGTTLQLGNTVLTNAGTGSTSDGYVAKLTDNGSTGTADWAQRIGGSGADEIQGLTVSGNAVYVAGYFTGTASFGSNILNSAGYGDVFVSKLNNTGSSASFAWTQQAGGTGGDVASSLVLSGTTLYAGGTATPLANFGSIPLATPLGTSTSFLASLGGNAVNTLLARSAQNPLAVYPNPAQGQTVVQLPAAATHLTLTDACGRLVRTYAFRSGTTEARIDLRSLAPGLYVLRTATTAQKLIVE